ncbi:MAG: alpha-hydroxy-acid oxidizing protein [Lachnospiraceae bacterium]|nr:alpha-hydroxy-acid oxidizing protein [Lachnospiraceae bacterium]MBD5456255.1 alpha-hydroxy-acid oxidizing protein [Lachnospiraceae bacterium]
MEQNMAGNSDQITRKYFDSLLLETRHIDGKKPDTSFMLYGERFDTPVMTAALSHLGNIRDNGAVEMARGAKMANAVSWTGMGEKKELQDMTETGAKVIKIIKPYADNRMIFDKIAHAAESGALAVGIDIDHAFNSSGDYDVIFEDEMRPKSMEEIREFVDSSEIPFIIKGILSERDAYKCLEAGVKGIVVSHHHGLMEYSLPPLKILPSIVKVIGGEIPVFVDCGIMSGMDAFKALALGATAVSVGRALMEPLKEKGAEGVKDAILKINNELKGAMAKTGCFDLDHMDSSVIWK